MCEETHDLWCIALRFDLKRQREKFWLSFFIRKVEENDQEDNGTCINFNAGIAVTGVGWI